MNAALLHTAKRFKPMPKWLGFKLGARDLWVAQPYACAEPMPLPEILRRMIPEASAGLLSLVNDQAPALGHITISKVKIGWQVATRERTSSGYSVTFGRQALETITKALEDF